jgi:hypothetical protein
MIRFDETSHPSNIKFYIYFWITVYDIPDRDYISRLQLLLRWDFATSQIYTNTCLTRTSTLPYEAALNPHRQELDYFQGSPAARTKHTDEHHGNGWIFIMYNYEQSSEIFPDERWLRCPSPNAFVGWYHFVIRQSIAQIKEIASKFLTNRREQRTTPPQHVDSGCMFYHIARIPNPNTVEGKKQPQR